VFSHVLRGFRRAVIGRKNYQGIVETDFLIYVLEKLSQYPIQAQDIILCFKTGGPKKMADIIGG